MSATDKALLIPVVDQSFVIQLWFQQAAETH